jgi:hypothetical protein
MRETPQDRVLRYYRNARCHLAHDFWHNTSNYIIVDQHGLLIGRGDTRWQAWRDVERKVFAELLLA